MSSSFRRLSKSKVGTAHYGLVGVLILVGFAMGDIQNVISGGAFSGGSDTLVKLGTGKGHRPRNEPGDGAPAVAGPAAESGSRLTR